MPGLSLILSSVLGEADETYAENSPFRVSLLRSNPRKIMVKPVKALFLIFALHTKTCRNQEDRLEQIESVRHGLQWVECRPFLGRLAQKRQVGLAAILTRSPRATCYMTALWAATGYTAKPRWYQCLRDTRLEARINQLRLNAKIQARGKTTPRPREAQELRTKRHPP